MTGKKPRHNLAAQVATLGADSLLPNWKPPTIPKTEDEANEAGDNGRNTGGKSYHTGNVRYSREEDDENNDEGA